MEEQEQDCPSVFLFAPDQFQNLYQVIGAAEAARPCHTWSLSYTPVAVGRGASSVFPNSQETFQGLPPFFKELIDKEWTILVKARDSICQPRKF